MEPRFPRQILLDEVHNCEFTPWLDLEPRLDLRPDLGRKLSSLTDLTRNVPAGSGPLVGFVEKVAAKDYALRLYATAAHMRLLVSLLPDLDFHGEFLWVEVTHTAGQFRFV